MTVEAPGDGFGNSKLDREIAAIFNNVNNLKDEKDPFPKIRIEVVGLDVMDSLDMLAASMSTEELDASPKGDTLSNFYNNDKFVREKIAHRVSSLLERTTQVVYLTSKENIGYVYMEGSEDEETSAGIYLLREEDRVGGNYDPAHTKERIQELWDTSNQYVRSDIISFAARTKGDIIDLFMRFARGYAMPLVDFDCE